MEILFVDNSVEINKKNYNVEAYEIGSFVCYFFNYLPSFFIVIFF